jgi:hypothetical protein
MGSCKGNVRRERAGDARGGGEPRRRQSAPLLSSRDELLTVRRDGMVQRRLTRIAERAPRSASCAACDLPMEKGDEPRPKALQGAGCGEGYFRPVRLGSSSAPVRPSPEATAGIRAAIVRALLRGPRGRGRESDDERDAFRVFFLGCNSPGGMATRPGGIPLRVVLALRWRHCESTSVRRGERFNCPWARPVRARPASSRRKARWSGPSCGSWVRIGLLSVCWRAVLGQT